MEKKKIFEYNIWCTRHTFHMFLRWKESQGLPSWMNITTPASLGYLLSVFNINSTLKPNRQYDDVHVCSCIYVTFFLHSLSCRMMCNYQLKGGTCTKWLEGIRGLTRQRKGRSMGPNDCRQRVMMEQTNNLQTTEDSANVPKTLHANQSTHTIAWQG